VVESARLSLDDVVAIELHDYLSVDAGDERVAGQRSAAGAAWIVPWIVPSVEL